MFQGHAGGSPRSDPSLKFCFTTTTGVRGEKVSGLNDSSCLTCTKHEKKKRRCTEPWCLVRWDRYSDWTATAVIQQHVFRDGTRQSGPLLAPGRRSKIMAFRSDFCRNCSRFRFCDSILLWNVQKLWHGTLHKDFSRFKILKISRFSHFKIFHFKVIGLYCGISYNARALNNLVVPYHIFWYNRWKMVKSRPTGKFFF